MPEKLLFQEHFDLVSNQLRIALSAGIVATWIVELDTYKVIGDPALFDFFDLPYNDEQSLPLDHFINSMHPEDRERVLAAINTAIADRTPYHIEYRVVGNTDRVRHVLASGKVNDPQNPTKFLGFIIDITDKKQLEEEKARYERELKEKTEALESLLKQYQFVTNFIPQHVWTLEPDGKVDYINQQMLSYLRTTFEEILLKGWGEFVHPEDRDKVFANWEQALINQDIFEHEFRLRSGDGTYQWFLGRGIPFFSEQKLTKWFGTNTLIEEQKQSLDKKDEFLSIASHELKTPLTTIKAFFQLAEKSRENPGSMVSLLAKAGKQVQRLEQLINDLLDVSKVNAGKMVYEFKPFNFNDALKDSLEIISNINSKWKFTLRQEADVVINGDKFRLEQVLNNLLSNAVKYSPDSSEVIIGAQLYGSKLIIDVTDFGVGIPPENLAQIFERYYRIDNQNNFTSGLGLGLYISSEIVKRHNGSMWVDSEPGKGTTFYVMLPVTNADDQQEVRSDDYSHYKSDSIDISVNAGNILQARWLGYQDYSSVKQGGLAMLDLVKNNNCTKVLNDNTGVIGNWSAGTEWGREVWFPLMQKAGVKYFAWIYPQSIFNKISAQKSVNIMLGQVTIQFFTEPEEGLKWLNDQSE